MAKKTNETVKVDNTIKVEKKEVKKPTLEERVEKLERIINQLQSIINF